MFNRDNPKSSIHKFPTNRAASNDEIFAERITCAGTSVCFNLRNRFIVHLMHGKIPQQCMKLLLCP